MLRVTLNFNNKWLIICDSNTIIQLIRYLQCKVKEEEINSFELHWCRSIGSIGNTDFLSRNETGEERGVTVVESG